MSDTVLAAQLYTVRDFTQSRDGLARSLEKVASIGYQAVQVSAIGDIPDAAVKRMTDDNGLSICNTHISYDRLCKALNSVIEQHKLWGCRHVAIGGMPNQFRGSEDGFKRFAAVASEIGEKTSGRRPDVQLSQSQLRIGQVWRAQRAGHRLRRHQSAVLAGGAGYLLAAAWRRRSRGLD